MENDINYQVYQEMLRTGELNHLFGQWGAFAQGFLRFTMPTYEKLMDKIIENKPYEGGVFIQHLGIEPQVVDIPTFEILP